MKPVLVAIADDFSGASDQAGMLSEAGVASLLVLDERFAVGEEWEAVTYATRLRALPVAAAKREAARWLTLAQSLQPRMIQYKYCSTFDSTPQGNIGPILDVALDALDVPGTIVMPALPVNGRTTYLGYHFVRGVPLNESPMRDHPLNPMTDANLVRWLQRQTPGRVGLLTHEQLRGDPREMRRRLQALWAEGTPYVVLDCLHHRHVQFIAEAVADLPFISGSSALPMVLPTTWERRGWITGRHPRPRRLAREADVPVLALAGSCAEQTLRQVAAARDDWRVIRPSLGRLMETDAAEMARALLPKLAKALRECRQVLVATSQQPSARARTLQRVQAAGLSARDFGLRFEAFLGEVARLAREELGIRHFLCAGGETSGAISQALGLRAVEIVRGLDPGVPLCRALPGRDIAVALKGGNFGTDDFFSRAALTARWVKLDA